MMSRRGGTRWAGFLFVSLSFACATEGGFTDAIQRMVSERVREPDGPAQPTVAVFDMDNTLIFGDISFAFLEFQVLHGRYGFDPTQQNDVLSPAAVEAFGRLAAATLDSERERARQDALFHVFHRYIELWESDQQVAACAYLARLLQGLSWDEARLLGRDALEWAMRQPRCIRRNAPASGGGTPFHEEIGIRLRPAMARMVGWLQDAGWDVWVVSASPRPVVEAVAERYGISANRVLAVTPSVKEGRLTHRVLEPVPIGAGKVAAIQRAIGRRPALAFGDARYDFDMLMHAMSGVLVDRGDPVLARELAERGVLIQPLFSGESAPVPCPDES